MDSENKRYKVLVTPSSMRPEGKLSALAALEAFASEIVFNPTGKPLAEKELTGLLAGCDGVIAGLDDFNGEVIRACAFPPKESMRRDGYLKVISRFGSGYDNIDLKAAREHGVVVTSTPGANAQSVADLTFGLLLCAARRIPALDRGVKSGGWPRIRGVELYNKTIGVIGLGAVGKAVAKRASGFSMNVIAYDIAIDMEYASANSIKPATLDALVAESDFISLHVPLNGVTRNMLSRDVLKTAKHGAVIVNTARGGLIDENAAYEMLSDGRLGGLGLDAFEKEPPDASPLFSLDNVILTPHSGSHTAEATKSLAEISVKNLIDVLSGLPCDNVVNK